MLLQERFEVLVFAQRFARGGKKIFLRAALAPEGERRNVGNIVNQLDGAARKQLGGGARTRL